MMSVSVLANLEHRLGKLLMEADGDRNWDDAATNNAALFAIAAVNVLPADNIQQPVFDLESAAIKKNVGRAFGLDKRNFSEQLTHDSASLEDRHVGICDTLSHPKNLVLTRASAEAFGI